MTTKKKRVPQNLLVNNGPMSGQWTRSAFGSVCSHYVFTTGSYDSEEDLQKLHSSVAYRQQKHAREKSRMQFFPPGSLIILRIPGWPEGLHPGTEMSLILAWTFPEFADVLRDGFVSSDYVALALSSEGVVDKICAWQVVSWYERIA